MSKRNIPVQPIFFTLVILAGTAAYYGGLLEQFSARPFQDVGEAEEKVWPVQAERIEPANHTITRTLFGKIVATRRPRLGFASNGCIGMLREDLVPGATVKKGEVVARLRTDLLDADLQDQTDRLAERRAQLLELQAKQDGLERIESAMKQSADIASSALERIETLRSSGNVSNAQLEQAQKAANEATIAYLRTANENAAAEAAIATQKNSIKLAENAVANARLALDRAELVSPIDGIVDTVSINAGDCIAASQAVATLIDPASFQAEFEMPSFLFQDLSGEQSLIGMTVPGAMAASESSDASFEIEITHVAPALEEARRMVRLMGRIEGETRDGALIADSAIEVQFPVQKLTDVYTLPRKVLTQENRVFVVDHERLKSVPVRIEAVHNGDVYFKADIPDGLPVLTVPLRVAMDGLKVSLINHDAAKP